MCEEYRHFLEWHCSYIVCKVCSDSRFTGNRGIDNIIKESTGAGKVDRGNRSGNNKKTYR